jgi:hypothetical protein
VTRRKILVGVVHQFESRTRLRPTGTQMAVVSDGGGNHGFVI